MIKRSLKLILLLSVFFVTFIYPVNAQEGSVSTTKYKAVISDQAEEPCGEESCTTFTLELLDSDRKGEKVEAVVGEISAQITDTRNFKLGDKVILIGSQYGENEFFYISDHIRTNGIILLFLVFAFITIAVAGKNGIRSLVGLALTFFVVLAFIIPLIIKGFDPVLVALFGGMVMAIPLLYFSHGFNLKTTIGLGATVLSLFVVVALAYIFSNILRLSGFGTEEASLLLGAGEQQLDLGGILLASVIFGGLGILDDVTISQVSVVNELHKANDTFSIRELYERGMNVGKDHIASLVNTLFLAYTGSSLPLILLLLSLQISFEEVINNEAILEDVLRAVVGSMGLVLAVPISTIFAAYIIKTRNLKIKDEHNHSHSHQ